MAFEPRERDTGVRHKHLVFNAICNAVKMLHVVGKELANLRVVFAVVARIDFADGEVVQVVIAKEQHHAARIGPLQLDDFRQITNAIFA